MKSKCKCEKYGPTVLRIALGLLMLIPGLAKIANPSGIIGMLGNLGFPASTFFGWVVILSEIGFGAALILGWKLRYTVWPPIAIIAVATILVTIPSFGTNPMAYIILLFHLTAVAGYISLYLTGPGNMAVKQ